MDCATILLVLLAAGVNFGWKPAKDSAEGYEYIVQVEPELLDVLRQGDSVPVESNVPPEVGPIRKVSLVVGHGDLPRDTVSAVQRTAYFAGQGGWTPDRYGSTPTTGSVTPSTGSAYDRYGQLPAASPRGVSPPPSVLERTQAAVTETGTALRDGVEAGIQAANQKFSRAGEQVLDATRNAGQEFGRQLQAVASDPVGQLQSNTNSLHSATEQASGAGGNPRQQVTNPFAASAATPRAMGSAPGNVAPPPWPEAGSQTSQSTSNILPPDQTAAAGMTPVRTGSGWTSIGPNVAAPPLIIPLLRTPPADGASALTRTAIGGPNFPAANSANRDENGFAQTDQYEQRTRASAAANDWADSWGSGDGARPAIIGRAGDSRTDNPMRGADLVPVQQRPGENAQSAQQAANSSDDPWTRDPWTQSPPAAPAGQLSHDSHGKVAAPRDAAAEWQTGTNPANSAQGFSANPLVGAGPNGTAPFGNGLNATNSQAPPNALAEQPPWLPLLLVSLSLMGSLSANLFLGWSYLDARQKYRSLVRKTADTFRRTGSAAA